MVDSDISKEDLDALAVLMADVRDEVIEASKLIASGKPPNLEAKLDDLLYLVSRTKPPPRRWIPVAVLGLGLGIGWYVGSPGEMHAQAKLMRHVDTLLAERYDTLPAGVRDSLQNLYRKAGFLPPGHRKGKDVK